MAIQQLVPVKVEGKADAQEKQEEEGRPLPMEGINVHIQCGIFLEVQPFIAA